MSHIQVCFSVAHQMLSLSKESPGPVCSGDTRKDSSVLVEPQLGLTLYGPEKITVPSRGFSFWLACFALQSDEHDTLQG